MKDSKQFMPEEGDSKRKDVLVPRKVADLLKACVKEREKMGLNNNELLVSSKSFKTVENIRQDIDKNIRQDAAKNVEQDIYDKSPDLFITFDAITKVKQMLDEKWDERDAQNKVLKAFKDGQFKTAGEKMVSADRSLKTAIMYCRKYTGDASKANKNLLKDMNEIIKHIETNKMKGSVFKVYAKDLEFLKKFFKICRDIVNIQELIGKYMSSWDLSAEGSTQKPSEGNKLIDKLEQEIKGTSFFIKRYCHPYFLPPGERLLGSSKSTDPRLDDTANLTPDEKDRRVVTYELHRLIGKYLPRIEDELYIKCLREATKSHGEVLKKHNDYQPSREVYDEALKERVRIEEKLDELFIEEQLAAKAKAVSYANHQLAIKAIDEERAAEEEEEEEEERHVDVPVENLGSSGVVQATSTKEDLEGKGPADGSSGSGARKEDLEGKGLADGSSGSGARKEDLKAGEASELESEVEDEEAAGYYSSDGGNYYSAEES